MSAHYRTRYDDARVGAESLHRSVRCIGDSEDVRRTFVDGTTTVPDEREMVVKENTIDCGYEGSVGAHCGLL